MPLVFNAEMRSLAFTLLTRPAALTVDSFAVGGPETDIAGSLVVNCGADADKGALNEHSRNLYRDVPSCAAWA